MDRLERLINLTATLIDTRRPLTLDELRERVPGYSGERKASRRAFERDKELLRELGIPLTTEPIDPEDATVEGYRILREAYQLPDPGLSADELAALHLAASAVRLEGSPGVEALWKLGGAAGDPVPPVALAALPGSEHLASVFDAVSQRRRVQFTYRDRKRTVDPYGLSFRFGHWYLSGRDHGHDQERSFRLDRFQSPPTVGEAGAFARPTALAEDPDFPWELGQGEPVSARLLVDASQAGWTVGYLGEEAVVERRVQLVGEQLVVEMRVTNRAAFRSFVLGFLDHAEVLSPPELRAEMVAWLESVP